MAVVFVLALFAPMAGVSGCVVAPQDEEDVPLELRGSAEYAEIMKPASLFVVVLFRRRTRKTCRWSCADRLNMQRS